MTATEMFFSAGGVKMNEAGAAWLRDQGADAPGYRWAVRECPSLREVVETARPEWMRWTVVRLLDRRGRVEWAWRAASRVRHLMQDARSTAALDVLRRWLDGQASDEELRAAADAAAAAYYAAAAAYYATAAAAWDAVATATATATAASYYAASRAAVIAAAVASAAAWHAESEAQRRDALELLDAAGWPA